MREICELERDFYNCVRFSYTWCWLRGLRLTNASNKLYLREGNPSVVTNLYEYLFNSVDVKC